jgi:hypothetical protein
MLTWENFHLPFPESLGVDIEDVLPLPTLLAGLSKKLACLPSYQAVSWAW